MKVLGLCCGINKFDEPGHDLSGCIPDEQNMVRRFTAPAADAKATAQVLVGLGVPPENITILTNHAVTKNSVLGWWDKALTQGADAFLWTHSGHGTQLPDNSEPDGYIEAICMADIREKNGDWDRDTLILDSEVHTIQHRIPYKNRGEFWFDTCFSGGMRVIESNPHPTHNKYLPHPNPDYTPIPFKGIIGRAAEPTANVVWTACSEHQTSADAFIDGGYHGVFTWAWCKMFDQYPGANRVNLIAWTVGLLKKCHYQQVPHLFCPVGLRQLRVGQ